jgi:hypothetical protein
MRFVRNIFVCVSGLVLLGGCGGAGMADSPPAGSLRQQAATTTAQSNQFCTRVQPFYWEIGDASGVLVGTTVGGSSPTASTTMLVASASKLIFGAYLVEKRAGQLTAADLKALRMMAGYTSFNYSNCIKLLQVQQDLETVNECFEAGANETYTAANEGKFFYGGGHFQQHASIGLGLGSRNNASLHDEIAAQIGADIPFTYDSPQPAAGVRTSAAGYAVFLRKILGGQLRMRDFLGTQATCTNPNTCASAVSTPISSDESWHYSLAHWVEDDPDVGDGAFSSPGAFGFYPWIDASKTYYGILARYDTGFAAYVESVDCGRLIRKAWLTGVAQ